MSKDRNCKMCVYYSENGCSQFNCQGTTTVDDIRAEERTMVADKFADEMIVMMSGHKDDILQIAKRIKEQK